MAGAAGKGLMGWELSAYLQRILSAQVAYDVAIKTSLQPAPSLSARLGAAVLLNPAVRQPHCHAIEQASRRWLGCRRDAEGAVISVCAPGLDS